MSKSKRLRLSDVRRVYRLLGECCELGADPIAWRMHLTEQMPAVFGAQVSLYWETTVCAKPFDEPFWLAPDIMLDFGWSTPSDRRPFEEHLRTGRPEEGPHITPDLLTRSKKVVQWSAIRGRNAWLESDYFNRYVKYTGIDDGIFAHHRIGEGKMRWMFANRVAGDPPFRARQRALMRLLNLELSELLGQRLSRVSEPTVYDLPPRLRQVLVCLMDGDSENQAALRLEISKHTVHQYVKQLHARFGVSSRGELLASCRKFWPVLERLQQQQVGVNEFPQIVLERFAQSEGRLPENGK